MFVCLKTRAIHIDMVTSLSTIAFIQCYDRFIARRNYCAKIYSDNGTQFQGAANIFKQIVQIWKSKEVSDHMIIHGTEWKFMKPAAPHQGGIYEAAVKSMKFHLKRIIGTKCLEYEQFMTLIIQIEAILNSRPICPLHTDPTDINALTPGHFLTGEQMVMPLPGIAREESDSTGVKLWKERQKMLNDFWKRWENEYLTTLTERKKWRKEKENVQIGQIVLLKAENFPPAQWGLARIIEVYKDKEGIVRNVKVKTRSGELMRPVQKLCILPKEDNTERQAESVGSVSYVLQLYIKYRAQYMQK